MNEVGKTKCPRCEDGDILFYPDAIYHSEPFCGFLTFVDKAAEFAKVAHAEQKRKYSGEPYFVHLQEVAELVAKAGGTCDMIAAAYLHDTVEDTGITLDDIRTMFGDEVASMVNALTNAPHSEGNRKARKKIDRERLLQASSEVKTIKLADLISNTTSIVERDPKFAKVYMAEKEELIKVLVDGDETLYQRALAMLAAYKCEEKE